MSHDKNSTGKSTSRMFFSGVFVLTLSNVLSKAIGLFFKIPLIHCLGELGMGYFNSAYTIYVWFYTISTAGLPVALSILISENRAKGNLKQIKKTFRIAVILFFIIGLLGMSIMIFGSGFFSELMKSDKSAYCIIAIAPTLFLVCISSAIRGYFQGLQNMVPTAVSQIIEALGKLVIGMLMAVYAVKKGYEIHIAAAYAIAGITISVAISTIFMLASKMLFKETAYSFEGKLSEDLESDSSKKILSRIVRIAVPITISSSVISLSNVIDLMIVLRRLQDIGIEKTVAVAMYGNYTTLAVPLFNLPPVLIYPIAYSIVPMIAATLEAKNKDRFSLLIDSSMRVTAMIAVPCALGMSAFSKPILNLLFGGMAESVEMAAPLLSILAISVLFVCMLSITNSILQSCGKESKPIISMLCGAAVKLVSSYILIGIPKIAMYGTPISTFLCYLTITAMNFYYIEKYVCKLPSVARIFVKPLISGILCVIGGLVAYKLLISVIPSKLITLVAIGIAAVIYVIAIFVIKGISADDIKILPKGEKIYRVLNKMKLM